MSAPARLLRACVRLYQRLTHGRPSPCRFNPTCSSYAIEALERHGAVRGSWLAVRRISRCHPWGRSGWDPVPEPAASTAAHREQVS
jgi:putative membrane protein insertion efficiency factor